MNRLTKFIKLIYKDKIVDTIVMFPAILITAAFLSLPLIFGAKFVDAEGTFFIILLIWAISWICWNINI